jgi:sugar phosphate isomerase/epimerase
MGTEIYMNSLSRRQFLAASAAGLAAFELHADPLGIPPGFQSYPVRDMIGKDFIGTLRDIAKVGYKSVEMCSPPGYEKSGFGSLINMKASEMRDAISTAGLRCESCHYQFREMKENLDDRIAYAKELGLKQMVVSTFALKRDATLDDWKRAADELNTIGEKVQKAGLITGFHNHDMEFKELDGKLVYDELMSRLDPKLVKMQFQVSVISLGYKAADYMTKYPGRFISLHLQDWSPEEKKTVAIGKGVVDWKKTFAAAKTGGVKNYFVEVNLDAMKESYPYLHQLKV